MKDHYERKNVPVVDEISIIYVYFFYYIYGILFI